MICFTFIFISGLIFTQSFTLAFGTANCTWMLAEEECFYDDDESYAEVIMTNSSEVMKFCYMNPSDTIECNNVHHPTADLHDFNIDKITCVLDMKNHLRCIWDVADLPKNAKFFADVRDEDSQHPLNCSYIVERKVLECHGRADIKHLHAVDVKVNISLPKVLYRITKPFKIQNIVKLDPPDNITISNVLKNLQINWPFSGDRSISESSKCYKYELKINDKVITLPDGQSSFTKQDIDLTRKYAFQVRVKLSQSCSNTIHWSDWSNVHEVGPFEHKYHVNLRVITVTALVLPMLLLAILLLCKFQRLPKKLFPPIPSPAINVKNLLEKDNYFQDLSSRYVAEDTEVVYAVEERNNSITS